jgi:outer membrane protein assembly factor BamB
MLSTPTSRWRLFGAISATSLLVAACASDSDSDAGADSAASVPGVTASAGSSPLAPSTTSSPAEASAGSSPRVASSSPEASEVAAAQPRVVLTYDGGVLVLDGTTLEVIGDHPRDGFLRVNPAGDGRHVMVTTDEGFQVLDTGVWTDGGTSFAGPSELTDDVVEADAAGHVVVHAGRTVLFADGTGDITSFATADLLAGEGLPETRTWKSETAHHGVAIELSDGSLLATIGDEESRRGVRVLDASGEEVARSEECPGVHGEGTAAGEIAVFGCEDGVLLYDGEFTKLAAPDEFGRTGNIFTTETSPVALGDYNADPDAESYLLSAVTLIDTATEQLQVVQLDPGVGYTFRGLARGPQDEAVVLGSDGSLHLIDEETGAALASSRVVAPWEGPAEWQDPHPAVRVNDGVAYVTEPAANAVHAVDLDTGDVIATAELDVTPNEIAVVTG